MNVSDKDIQMSLFFGIIIGALATFLLLKDRPSNPYEVCLQYWGQKYYGQGEYGIVAKHRAEKQCVYEKTGYDGEYSNG